MRIWSTEIKIEEFQDRSKHSELRDIQELLPRKYNKYNIEKLKQKKIVTNKQISQTNRTINTHFKDF